ncbi:MAG: SpoIIE family protein phosphatase, partial [Spirochaetales bacterium]|nr:SpoIIE family protein phosphatase [Spirochaetales bacterium]
MKKRRRRRSISDKVSASTLNSAFGVLVSAVVIIVLMQSINVLNSSKATIENLAYSISQQVDGSKFKEAAETATGDFPSSVLSNQYVRTFKLRVANLMKRYEHVKAVSFIVFSEDKQSYTYVFEVEPHGSEEAPGLVEPSSEVFKQKNLPVVGDARIPAAFSNSRTYGSIIITAEPIMYNGVAVGYVCIDMALSQPFKEIRMFSFLVFLYLALISFLNMLFVRWYYKRNLVRPINQIIEAAKEYIYEDIPDEELELDTKHTSFQKLRIDTGDELQQLANAMKNMEIDLGRYIDHLTKVTSEKQRMSTELALATRIQAHMLPSIFPPFPERDEFDLYATMAPAKEVGGDFYDFFMVDHDHLALVVADVSGKGIPAAMFMMISKIIIKNVTQSTHGGELSPAYVLQKANTMLCENNEDEMFVTVWLGILEISTGKLTYANAGHEKPLFLHDGVWAFDDNRHGFVLAGMDGMRYKDFERILDPGDFIFQYTDGVTEATNSNEELFGEGRVMAVAKRSPLDTTEFLKNMRAEIDGFVKEAPQFDDITMLGLRYNGVGSKKRYEMNIEAKVENLDKVLDFINEKLEVNDCPMKVQMQIDVAVEELFVNVANYAYAPNTGDVLIQFVIEESE